jgi:FkbM family methyltransferase
VGQEDSVLEAGSGIGFIALFCMRKLHVRNYTMVEANPALAPIIRKNFVLNGVDCPSLVTAAVAARDGEISFSVSRDFWASSALRVQGASRVTVPALSIPTLLARIPYRPTTLVMDIEGSEADIPIEHFLPFRKIVMETHGRFVGTARIDALLASLGDRGFRRLAQHRDSYAFVQDGR